MPLPQPRLALATIVLSLVALFAVVAPAARPAQAQTYDGIADVALKYEGTHGGQCWIFVQQVVLEATGRKMGFDYRQGFFDAGAIEVSVQDARAGDIIQIIDDAYTAPDADYGGMHTAIVLENHGDGTFKVVDSNRNWDEMVSVHDGYNPAELAANAGLDFHIYRIDGEATPASAPPLSAPQPAPRVPTDPTAMKRGDTVQVVTPGEYLNLRAAPEIGNNVVAKLQDGTRLTVTDGPLAGGNGLLWVKVTSPLGEGWVAAQYLAKEKADVPATGGQGGTRPLLPFRSFLPGVAFGE
jgi:hypothetical protein